MTALSSRPHDTSFPPYNHIKTPRDAEYEIIARVTQKLIAADQGGAENRHARAKALHDNELLWSTLASDVLLPQNPLPPPLKLGIVALYRFVARESQALRGSDLRLTGLVEVNKSIMRGLKSGSAA